MTLLTGPVGKEVVWIGSIPVLGAFGCGMAAGAADEDDEGDIFVPAFVVTVVEACAVVVVITVVGAGVRVAVDITSTVVELTFLTGSAVVDPV